MCVPNFSVQPGDSTGEESTESAAPLLLVEEKEGVLEER